MIKIDIVNKTKTRIDDQLLQRFLKKLVATAYPTNSIFLELMIISKTQIARMNRKYLQHIGATDILSFPQTKLPNDMIINLGGLVISLEYINQHNEDIFEVLTHGFVHLMGFDHESDPKEWQATLKKVKNDLSKI